MKDSLCSVSTRQDFEKKNWTRNLELQSSLGTARGVLGFLRTEELCEKESPTEMFSCWLIVYVAPPRFPFQTFEAGLRWAVTTRTHPSERASLSLSLPPSTEEQTSVRSSRSCAAPTCRSDDTLQQMSSLCRRWGTSREHLSLRSSAPAPTGSTPVRRPARPVLVLLLPQMELRSSD